MLIAQLFYLQTFCGCFKVRPVMAVETDDDQNNVTKRYKSIEDNKTTSTSGNNGAVSMG